MLFPGHLTLLFNFLFLWGSKIEASNVSTSSVCQDFNSIDYFFQPEPEYNDIELEDIKEKCLCQFYPTNVLKCSWALDYLNATQIVLHISICDSETSFQPRILSAEEKVGSESFVLQNFSYVILQFNITLQGNWMVYTAIYDKHNLEVPPPPGNISASLSNENLLVTWSLPKNGVSLKPSCFKYQLDIDDGEAVKDIPEKLSYTVVNVDPSQTYRVRMRASFRDICQPRPHWSEWSHVSVVGTSRYRLSLLVIVLILLGIPMILLALLLLVRYQRVCKTIFPPIPRPPPKYLYFLEKNDGVTIYHPRTPVEEEVITVVLYD